jgi:hypothetical protein
MGFGHWDLPEGLRLPHTPAKNNPKSKIHPDWKDCPPDNLSGLNHPGFKIQNQITNIRNSKFRIKIAKCNSWTNS